MAMMMTGRVLLVCALCVLWCGGGGIDAREVDNNALGGCTAWGVSGDKSFYVPSRCNKAALTPPLRHVFSISAAVVSTEGQVSATIGRDLVPVAVPPPPPPPPPPTSNTPKASEAPTSRGVSQTGEGTVSGGGGGSGQSGNPNGSGVSTPEPSPTVVTSPSFITPEVDASQNKGGAPSDPKLVSSKSDEPPASILVQTDTDTQKDTIIEENPESPHTKEKANIRATDGNATGSEAGRSGVDKNGHFSVLSAESQLQHRETKVTKTSPPTPSPGHQKR
ncbi:mucin-associated surface protein (MASP), putative [Trypanosoma cruzi marinkellei]|uniref:Mucin-associated surface protein (MASP), putative n=1 Tax=Trypanosoma cruzi marinkellei TaxID=85056 RepID=K2MRK5_TRYCR|nr:mucin-associated surface protein (MASP), putative [Trypanosoma cruzi marinkellei]